MKRAIASLCLLPAVFLSAQTVTSQQAPRRAEMVERHVPTYADIYCAGFLTDRTIQGGLFVVAGEEGGLKNIYSDRDIIYLSRGAGYIVNPGGEYRLLRPVRDPVRRSTFTGQQALIKSLGQVYEETGRIRVNIVHEQTAMAQVLHACSDIQPGDIAIPFDQKPFPQLIGAASFDRFAPPTGKNLGLIVTGKHFASLLGVGDIAYLNIGANAGVAVGQSYRIFRTFATAAGDPNRRYLNQTPTHLSGMRQGYRLTREQQLALPRDVLGEIVITWVEGRSAVGIITVSRAEIFAGDEVELQ